MDGRIALVTGGSRGIGRGIALALGRAGAAVAVNYRSREAEAAATVSEIEQASGKAIAVRADVAVRDDVDAMVAYVAAEFGRAERWCLGLELLLDPQKAEYTLPAESIERIVERLMDLPVIAAAAEIARAAGWRNVPSLPADPIFLRSESADEITATMTALVQELRAGSRVRGRSLRWMIRFGTC